MLKKEQLTLKHNWGDKDKSKNLGIREIYNKEDQNGQWLFFGGEKVIK